MATDHLDEARIEALDRERPVLEERGSRKEERELRQWLASSLPLIGDAQALDLIEHLAADEQPDKDKVEAGKRILEQIRAVSVE